MLPQVPVVSCKIRVRSPLPQVPVVSLKIRGRAPSYLTTGVEVSRPQLPSPGIYLYNKYTLVLVEWEK